jgi:hypothetical protein
VSAKKVLLGLFALGLLVLVGLGVAAVILVPRYVEREVIAAAKQRGIELEPGEIAFGWGWVQVANSRARLVGVRSVKLGIKLADVALDGRLPLVFALADVTVDAVGNPLVVADELSAWSKAYEKLTPEPVTINGLALTFRTAAGAEPELTMSQARMVAKAGRVTLDAPKASLYGRALGPLRLGRDAEKVALLVTLGQTPIENPLLNVEIRSAEQTLVHAALRPISVGELGKALGIALPRPDIGVSGSVDLSIPKSLLSGRVTGRVDFALKGYVPPHPIELDGFVFGDTTSVASALELQPERLRIEIKDARVKAGRFEVTGGGELRAEGRNAGRLLLLLRGELPCNALAGIVAETRLGRALGKLSGKAARTIIGGGVGVRVSVDVSTDKPDKAQIVKTITPGCGLRPLSFEELVKLGELAPEALDPAVLADLKKVLEEGIHAPPNSALPNLEIPGLGKLDIPLLPGFGKQPPPPKSTGGAAGK